MELPRIGWLKRELLISTDTDEFTERKLTDLYEEEDDPFDSEESINFEEGARSDGNAEE